jgi:hypothetical protein
MEGGWFNRTALKSDKDETVNDGMDCDAKARSDMINS